MKKELELLANETLALDAPGDFTGEDLVNALLVLQSVSFSIAFKYQQSMGLTFDQMSLLAEEFGKNLRQSLTLFTGIDPADAVRVEVCGCGHSQDWHSCANDADWREKPKSPCYFSDDIRDYVCECAKFAPPTR